MRNTSLAAVPLVLALPASAAPRYDGYNRFVSPRLDGQPVIVENAVTGQTWSAWSYSNSGELDLALSFREAGGSLVRPDPPRRGGRRRSDRSRTPGRRERRRLRRVPSHGPAEARRLPERRARLRDRQPGAERQRPRPPVRRGGPLAGPPALFLEDATSPSQMKWSADGRWLAITGNAGLALFERDTNARRQLSGSYENPIGFSSDSRRLVTRDMLVRPHPELHVWAVPEGRLERTLSRMPALNAFFLDDRVLVFAPNASVPDMAFVQRLSLDGTDAEVPARLHDPDALAFDPSGTSVAVADGGQYRLLGWNGMG